MTVAAREVSDAPTAFKAMLCEITDVHSRFDFVRVRVEAEVAWMEVSFADLVSLRVVDERDLMEFWPTCSSPNGSIFEIPQGGLLDQERARQGSNLEFYGPELREYLVTGISQCVSVLTTSTPHIKSGPRWSMTSST